MTNVLIPTDFSENAWNAIQYGVQFFKKEPVRFFILHVRFNPGLYPQEDVTPQGITLAQSKQNTQAEKQLSAIKEKIETLFPNPNHSFQTMYQHGLFVEGVKKVIAEKNIDFIVMGTKGASGIKEVTVGSRTGEVITRVKCPILVIPEKAKFSSTKEIVFPTDFNLHYKQKVLLTLSEVVAMQNASIHVLHMTKSNRPLTEQQTINRNILEDFLFDIPHSFHYVENQSIEEVLESFVDVMEIDMIAMVAKNINFFQRLLFRPRVAKISYHTKVPFLVLHE